VAAKGDPHFDAVLITLPAIVDILRHPSDQVKPQPADGAILERPANVRFRRVPRIEWPTIVLDPRHALVSSNEDDADLLVMMTPRQILPFEELPLVILTPLQVPQSWDANFFAPLHPALRSEARILEQLGTTEVGDILMRIRGTSRLQ